LVNLRKAGPRSTARHLQYLERDGTTPTGAPGRAYGDTADQVDVKAFEHRGQGDRHQFRFIVSAEEGTELKDLDSFTRQLMRQMERDLGTRLDWIAVDHWDTGHPHTHIVLRGKDQNGRDLVIAREYISHGMRARAREVATEWLGLRTRQEIEASNLQEVSQERWTGLDATIRQETINGFIDVHSLSAPSRRPHERAVIIGRLKHLSTMGLAEENQSGIWRIAPNAPDVLRTMGERGDIIRTMQRALGKGTRDYQIFDPATASQPVIGRIVSKGLHDELSERGYLIVDALDGRAHYAALAADVDMTALPTGAIVEFRPTGTRTADRQVLAAAVRGTYRPSDHLAHLRTQEPQAQEPAALIQGYVRRLEALRRGGIVERISEDVWRIPADLPVKGRAFDLKRLDGVSVELRCHLPVERQAQVIGATWLDQQLVRGSKDLPNTEFGRVVRNALQKREEFLINERLARRAEPRVVLAQNLLATLRDREIADAGARLEATTGLIYRPTIGDGRVSGTYRESAQLVSGRFAILEDGLGFSMVPWRPVIERRLGQHLSAITQGPQVSWELGRSRKLSL
jgi:type IV secretory pathway VirD2 relaxase